MRRGELDELLLEDLRFDAQAQARADALEEEDGPRCRRCGCTDERACAAGCVWAERDLCSRCAR